MRFATSLVELHFHRAEATALDGDLSGIWTTDGIIFLQPELSPGGKIEEFEGEIRMTRVPEPGTWALFAMAIPMLFLLRRRRSSDRV